MSRYTPLNIHSHYSLLSALPKIPDLVAYAKKLGYMSLALTDNGNLYGAIEFYKTCVSAGIKPIIGVDFYMATRTRSDKQTGVDNRRTRLVLLAKNLAGYKNLMELVTSSHLEGFYYKPRIDRELIEKHRNGLIALIPFWNSELREALRGKDFEKAGNIAAFYKKQFGADNLFLQITRQSEREKTRELEDVFRAFAKKETIPIFAGHEVYYIAKEDKKARDTLTMVNSNAEHGDRARSDEEIDLSFSAVEAIEETFHDIPEAVQNTARIADSCRLELTLGRWVFPDYKTENGLTHDEELEKLVREGVIRRGIQQTPDIEKRIAYELGIIKDKGYAPYFLVVGDLIRYAHEHGILTTIRGSVADSLVTYLAGITNVDPIAYKLPFERFLNPERPSAPDIDMDFADNRRDEMIEYVKEKYGPDKVAQIGTFGTMMARGAVRDIARAMSFEYSVGDRIAKLIPFGSQGFPMSIDHALELVPELATLYKEDEDTKTVIDMAKKIEGCVRHISVHAAGVVIAPTPLTDYTPLQFDPKGEGKIITQYDMYAIEDAGLLKFDFLGIKNLAILAEAVLLARKLEGVSVDIENVPIDDKKTFEMLALGETGGLFQLNGGGMTRYLKELRPTTIHDINAMVALYHPGPMENISQYIERKHKPMLVQYLDPRLREILADSYGVITYQDDVLLIAVRLGGYSWGEADKLRKAMGKKIPKEMESQKEKLTAGFIKNGMDKERAERMWRLIEPFAAYGFNKAHAASYGKVAYQTAYMKANFPAIYMSAVLSADSGDVEKIGETVAECNRMGIAVLPPSINESYSGFTVVKAVPLNSPLIKGALPSSAGGMLQPPPRRLGTPFNNGDSDKIRFGLTTIKNFGEGVAHSIIEERKRAGPFKSLANFLERVTDKNLNKKSLEALIKSGALDEMGERGVMLANLELLLENNKESSRKSANQDSLFGLMADTASIPTLKLATAPQATTEEKLAWEKELLGLYISGHPLDRFRDILEKRETSILKIKEEYKDGMVVVAGGIIEEVKPIITKRNEVMAFIRLADLSSSIEVVVFPKMYGEFKTLITQESCVAIKGRFSTRNGTPSLIAEKIKELK